MVQNHLLQYHLKVPPPTGSTRGHGSFCLFHTLLKMNDTISGPASTPQLPTRPEWGRCSWLQSFRHVSYFRAAQRTNTFIRRIWLGSETFPPARKVADGFPTLTPLLNIAQYCWKCKILNIWRKYFHQVGLIALHWFCFHLSPPIYGNDSTFKILLIWSMIICDTYFTVMIYNDVFILSSSCNIVGVIAVALKHYNLFSFIHFSPFCTVFSNGSMLETFVQLWN